MRIVLSTTSILVTALIFSHCNNPATVKEVKADTTNTVSAPIAPELKAGGLYLLKNTDSSYSIVKLLVLDADAVHLRTYADTFKQKPQQVNSADLKILIGHAPIDRTGFLKDNPILLNVEPVKDTELEGYKLYLQEMQKAN